MADDQQVGSLEKAAICLLHLTTDELQCGGPVKAIQVCQSETV
jgi:hypothetical protein